MPPSPGGAVKMPQQVNGFYVHSSPPKVLQVHSSVIRQWVRAGDLKQLEQLVLDGQGHKLVGEYSADGKVRAFLKQVPGFLVRSKRLHEGVAKGELKQVQKVLNSVKGQEPPMRNIHLSKIGGGLGLLHEAVYYGHTPVVEFLVSNFPESLKMKDNDGRSPLHYCGASKEAGKIWPMLVSAGAEPTAMDSRGRNAIYYMERSNEIHLPEDKLMTGSSLKSAPDSNTRLSIKPSNIRIWIHDRDLRKLQQVIWEGHGAKLGVETSNHPKVKRFLEGVPYILNIIKDVHSSVVNDDFDGFSKKTSPPAPPEILVSKDANGLTPLHKAAGLNRWNIATDILKRTQSAVFAVDRQGKTPLHYAAVLKDGNAMYNFLKNNSADETALDKNGHTPQFYKTAPKEVNTQLLQEIPKAPRTSTTFPSTFDWSLFHSQRPPAISAPQPPTPTKPSPLTPHIPIHPSPTPTPTPTPSPTPSPTSTPTPTPTPTLTTPTTPTNTNHSAPHREPDKINGVPEGALPKGAAPEEPVPEQVEGGVGGNEPVQVAQRPEEGRSFDIWTNEGSGDEGKDGGEEGGEEEREEGGVEGEGGREQNSEGREDGEDEGIEGGKEGEGIEGGKEGEGRTGGERGDVKVDGEGDRGREEERGVWEGGERVGKTEREIAEERQRLLDEGLVMGGVEEDRGEEERRVEEAVGAGNMEKLAWMVLNGEGEKLLGKKCSIAEVQSFVDNVGNYMEKISGVHDAVRKGSLKELQGVLDRRKFAVAKRSGDKLGATPLHEAVIHGRVSIMRYLGRFPETLTSTDNFGRTPLHYAAALGDRHLYDILLHMGADPKATDDKGRTATFHEDTPAHPSGENLLPPEEVPAPKPEGDRGVSTPVTDPSIHNAEGEVSFDEGIPLSKRAGSSEEEDNHEDSSQANFNITDRDEYGQSVLHFAAARAHGRGGLFQLIQESGINLGYRDELYRTARDIALQANIAENVSEIDKYVISLAAKGETGKLVELFLEGYDHILDLEDDEGIDIMTIVSNKDYEKTLSFLKAIPALEEKRERLHRAVRAGDCKAVEDILSESKNGRFLIIGKNGTGRCSLHSAVLCQQKDTTELIAQKYPETLRIGDNLERTPLHYAMGVEEVETLSKILIKCGAKRVAKDLKGRQPTYYFMNKMEILKLQEEENMRR